jgi:signal transduction histidine kinase
MRERVRHLGGELTIESNGSGTKVSASFTAQIRSATDQSASQQVEVA